MNNISAPRHVITGGTISATYPDNARIIISDNAEVTFSALTIGSGCTFVLGQFCSVTINTTATVGSNTHIIRKTKRATPSERIVPKIKRNDSPFQNEAYL